MQTVCTDSEHAPDGAQATRIGLDRRVFYLRTLYDTAREISGLIQPNKILDAFLLMTMGALGVTHGLAILLNTRIGGGHLVHRGMGKAEADELERNIPRICRQYFNEQGQTEPPLSRPKILTRERQGNHALFPEPTKVLVLWTLSEEYSGLVGLGEKLSGTPFDNHETELLFNLAGILINTLSHALFTKNIQQLNADLENKNTALQAALKDAEAARKDLDRRVFHLKSLYDFTTELSPFVRTNELLQAFLLMTMGTFGVSKGFSLLYERQTKTVWSTFRGISGNLQQSPKAVEKLLYKCFEAAEKRTFASMSATRIEQPQQLLREAVADEDFGTALMFVIDQSLMGLIGLGPTLTGGPLGGDEQELLEAQTAGFMVFLKNVRSFETIDQLNQDLQQRNTELRRTIADLTEARQRITVLEKARAQIRSLLQRETDRMGRVGIADLVLIFGIAAVISILFNFSSPHGLPLLPEVLLQPSTPTVDAATARQMVQAGQAVLVDARPPEFYAQKHIANAVNIPAQLFDIVYRMKLARALRPEQTVIVYGRNISTHYDEEVAHHLLQRDHERVKVLAEGLAGWVRGGYPTEP